MPKLLLPSILNGKQSNFTSLMIIGKRIIITNMPVIVTSSGGKINSVGVDFTNELSGVTYKTRLDTPDSWVQHSNLESLQSWINTNVIGNEEEGTRYWIRCVPVYKKGHDGEAVNVVAYDVLTSNFFLKLKYP